MQDINNVTMVGRLVQDAKTKGCAGGVILEFSLATNRTEKQDNEYIDAPNFFDCVLWKREALAQYLTKGKQVAIQGQLKQERWKTKG